MTGGGQELFSLLYIAGYGRSGSTLLDILFSNAEGVATVGALNNLPEWVSRREKCACGEELEACSFWSEILRKLGEEDKNFVASLGDEQVRCERSFRLAGSAVGEKYADMQRRLFRVIQEKTKATTVVDSSKTTLDCFSRPYALYHACGLRVRMLHLIRDPRGVVWSAMKGAGSPERKRLTDSVLWRCVKTSISWNLANWAAIQNQARLPRRDSAALWYEKLCDAPKEELERLGKLLEIPVRTVTELIERDGSFEPGHNLGGNRLRFQKSIRFQPDQGWKKEMPAPYRLLTLLITFPIYYWLKATR